MRVLWRPFAWPGWNDRDPVLRCRMTTRAPWFVAIGASGSEGLGDIKDVLAGLTPLLDAIVMIVLHRPSDRISRLQRILARHAHMPIVIASEAESMSPSVCYIGEPDGHLTLTNAHVAHLVPGSGNRMRNQTIDMLFKSLADHAGQRTIGIVLSGALSDGSRGLAAIHDAGGLTMVLYPDGKPRGMQQNAIEYDGTINLIGSAGDIARAVNQVVESATVPLQYPGGP